jgi:predicted CXXCH cytochrome family protein
VVIFPPDGALLGGDGAIAVLGYRPAGPPVAMTISAKGATRTVPLDAGSFSVPVKLEAGESVLAVGDRKIKVFVGAAGAAAPGYSAPDPHAVDNSCDDCHSFAGGAAKLIKPPPALCLNCHDDVLKGPDGKPQAVLHPPAEEGDCLACHPFHRLSIKALPAAARRELCFGCHDDFTGGGKKRMHAPVAKGECTGCHGAHAAAGKKLLPATGVKLCLLCHADPSKTKDGKDLAVQHPALDDGCAACHLPHVSDAPRLLARPAAQLCADCHDPFPAEEGGKKLLVHSPVEEGECAGCHAVHGSEAPKLLAAPGKALCVKCHDDPTLGADGKAWGTAHPALDDGCLVCHRPHVAPAPGMLKSGQAQLCAECHDPFPAPAAGGSSHKPVTEGKCSACHGPHGSALAKLLLASPAQALCVRCHKDPALDSAGQPWAVPHPALDDGCPSCHLPHVAPAARLLAKPQAPLCTSCHEDKNLGPDGQPWVTPHPPVAEGLCVSCHRPHGSRERALLVKPGNELCLACHTEAHARHRTVELDAVTGQPLATDAVTLPQNFPVRKKDGSLSCVGCHLPHGSNYPSLWPNDQASFCSRCHRF